MRPTVMLLMSMLLLSSWSTTTAGDLATCESDRDATLIEHPDGALANGSGPFVFVGRTGQGTGALRRALLRFDVAGAVPPDARIEHVRLTVYVAPSNPAPRPLRLYRVLADWTEGASSSAGGQGTAAGLGDVTWIHTFYDTEFWVHAGGQFTGSPSAEADIADSGFYTIEGPGLTRDVRLWNAAPDRNFGWVLIGDETEAQTAKSLASREHPDPVLRPMLEIVYRGGRGGDRER